MPRLLTRAACAVAALGAVPAVCAAVQLSVVNINPVPDTLVQLSLIHI